MPGRSFAAVGLIVCLLAVTAACGSRHIPVAMPAPPVVEQVPQIPGPVVPPPQPLPSTPVTTPRPEVAESDCAVIAEPGEPIAVVALADRIDPANAPRPTNDGEQLLFRQVYETMVRVDCKGRVLPGLAASWRLDPNGRTWIVTLRDNARFADGTLVSSSDVRASWTRGDAGDELQPQVSRLVESVVAIDDRTLAIAPRRPRPDVPLELAHADLAIARRTPGSSWPLGTRADLASVEPDSSPGAIATTVTVRRDTLPSLRFIASAGDPRDLLDRDPDLLLTRDPAALEYAATLTQFQAVPLDWNRVHVLVTPEPSSGSAALERMTDDARQALAGDAVRGEARAAVGSFWWEALHACEVAPPQPRPQAAVTPRIVYDASDRASRELAERLVGLTRRPDRAVALAGAPLAATLRRGRDAGYVFALDRRPLDPCRDIRMLIDRARWLDPATIVPLVETRLRAIVRRGKSGLVVDGDGGLLIAGTGGRE